MRNSVVWRALTLALCASALVSAGCGGDNNGNAGYKSAVSSAANRWAAAAHQFARSTASSRAQADAAAVDAFGRASATFAGQLAAIKPPAIAQRAHNALVASLRTLGDALIVFRRAVKGAVGATNTSRLQAAEVTVLADLRSVRSAHETLRQTVK